MYDFCFYASFMPFGYKNNGLFWIHHGEELCVVDEAIMVDVGLVNDHLNLSLRQRLSHELHDKPEFSPGQSQYSRNANNVSMRPFPSPLIILRSIFINNLKM